MAEILEQYPNIDESYRAKQLMYGTQNQHPLLRSVDVTPTNTPNNQQLTSGGLADYGKRTDGTLKQNGFFGPLPMQDGTSRVATEMSVSFDYGNGDVLVPLINPLLTNAEKLYLLQGNKATEEIKHKAGQWGLERIRQGRSPFAEENEIGQYK
jgi:hypothetical protein